MTPVSGEDDAPPKAAARPPATKGVHPPEDNCGAQLDADSPTHYVEGWGTSHFTFGFKPT